MDFTLVKPRRYTLTGQGILCPVPCYLIYAHFPFTVSGIRYYLQDGIMNDSLTRITNLNGLANTLLEINPSKGIYFNRGIFLETSETLLSLALVYHEADCY